MDQRRMQAMSNRIARRMMGAEGERDEALENVDQAVDSLIAAIQSLYENLPHVKTDNVPQRAAIDAVQELLDEAIAPYTADLAKAMQVFE